MEFVISKYEWTVMLRTSFYSYTRNQQIEQIHTQNEKNSTHVGKTDSANCEGGTFILIP